MRVKSIISFQRKKSGICSSSIEALPQRRKKQALRELGISHSTYYDWKKKFKEKGLLGLVNQPPIPHSHPNKLLEAEVAQLIKTARKQPEMGYRQVAYKETLQNALKKAGLPSDHSLKLVTDNGSQYLSKRFRQYLKKEGIEHIRTAYKHPETNGKIERYHRTLKEKMRLIGFKDPQDAANKINQFNEYYNTKRVHQKLGYVTPLQAYRGEADQVRSTRKVQREKARQRRRVLNQATA